MKEWTRNAWQFQQERYQQLGCRKWDVLDGNKTYLTDRLRVAFEMCYGENYMDNKIAKKITERVQTEAEKLFTEKKFNKRFACTFLNTKLKENDKEGSRFCVFWLQHADGKERCLDLSGRNYESWSDFLENNKLPKCYIIYPRCGRYYNEVNPESLFVDVMLEESQACSALSIAKDVFDVVSVVGGAAATGVLVLNPVGASVLIGAGAVGVVTGAYSVGNSVNKLVDIHKRDGGLDLTESKTLLAIGELTLSAVGTVAVGASAGIKGVAAKTGTVLSEGSAAYKLANNVSKISRVFSGINAGFYVIVVIDSYNENGCLTKEAKLHLMRILLFSFNAVVTEALIESMISYLASTYSVQQLITFCMGSPFRIIGYVNDISKFCTGRDLGDLINLIFPDFNKLYIRISNLKPLVNRVGLIMDRTLKAMKNHQFDIEYVYFVQKNLLLLRDDYENYKKKTEKEIQERFDRKTLEVVNQWTRRDGIDLNESNSSFENKINTPFEIKKKIAETVVMCSKRAESPEALVQREKFLFSEFLKLAELHELKDSTYVINKISFYCNKFQSLFNELMESYHFRYFLYTVDNGYEKSQTAAWFFRSKLYIHNIFDHVYIHSLQILNNNIEELHQAFEKEYVSSSPINEQDERVIFKFEMPCVADGLEKEEFYEKAKELVPKLESKLNDESTTFDDYGGMTIIKSNNDEFILFFYSVVENDYLKGILLLVEHFSD